MKITLGEIRGIVREVLSEARPVRPPVGVGSTVPGSVLAKGMRVEASYKKYNEGTDRVEILGVTGPDPDNEEVAFDSVRDAMRSAGVTSLRALEAAGSYKLVVRELPYGDSGAWYYLSSGRWVRGSGAERLTFVLIQ